MSLIRAFAKGSLCLLFGTQGSQLYAIGAEALEFKCQTTQKSSITSQLQAQKAANPMEAPAIDACVASVSKTYQACAKTIETAAATGGGASVANVTGQQTEFQAQKEVASATSQLSQRDMLANQACSQSAKTSQSSCSKYSSAKGYLAGIDSKCSADAQTAANNKKNLDQLESADKELADAPPSSPPQSTPSATPPPSETPPLEQASSTPNMNTSDSSYSSPNFIPPTLPNLGTDEKSLTTNNPNGDSKKEEPTYSAGSFPTFTQAYEDLTGKEPSADEVASFIGSSNPSANGGSSGTLSPSSSASHSGVAAKSGKNSDESSSELGGEAASYGGGGLSLASYNPNMPDISSGPGLMLPSDTQGKSFAKVTFNAPENVPAVKNKKAGNITKELSRVKAIPQRNGKILYTTASVGAADSSGDSDGNGSRGLLVSLFFGTLSIAGFAVRKFGIA